MPENLVVSRIVRQCREQWFWAHALLGWLITLDAAAHVVAVLTAASKIQDRALGLWTTGFTAGILLFVMACLSSAGLRRKVARVVLDRARRPDHTDSLPWASVHWILSAIACLLMVVHAVSRVSWMMIAVVSIGSIVPSIIRLGRQAPALESEAVEILRVPTSLQKVLVVLEINLSQTIRAGESYYFKVDGTPIRVAWIRRYTSEQNGAHYSAFLIVSGTPRPVGSREIRGPFVLPIAPAMMIDRTLDILTTDSGIVEAWSGDRTGLECDTDDLFVQRLKQYREARVMLCAQDGDDLRDVLQDHMPLGPHSPYLVGEHLRSHRIHANRLDLDAKMRDHTV
ncbi:hypothetical protein CGGC5_v016972 [Colletotrichum fructicola Nara gc5]|uniref:Uncharacterized protein n=1 Tax=Colletotrichum fructicola (strain Nara gc5) TaxID=1213859 RepID=A0A7J6ID21_COLFN|nr:hypothetical protein CGGC5_v016972 [Colletotrichum fructicola Nara gc5]